MNTIKAPKFSLIAILIVLFTVSCSKDDNGSEAGSTPQFNELGLQIDIKPINQDTLTVYSPTAIEIVNQSVSTNDFGTEYTLNLEATNPEKIKKGNIIVDYANGGRLWIIKDAPGGNRTDGTSNRTNGITAILGSLDTFFTNAIVEVATATNRAKNTSSNPNKLESGKFKLYSGTDPLVTVNLPDISINEESVADGVTLSVDNNTVNVNLSNVQLYSNNSNTFNVTIPEGSLQVNNAVDMRYKYLPLSTVLVGVPVNIGSLQEFDSSIYTTIDTNVKLDIEATTNGTVNLIDPIDKELGSYTKIIPIPPYFAASVRVSLKAKLTVTADAQLNITPEISTKNNFEARASYDGLLSLPTFQPEFQNIETNLANSINGDFNLNQRLEIIPEVEVYAFGLLGPKGELITYQEFNANANIQNTPLTWDTEIDLGVDYNTSLDVSVFHIDQLTGSIASDSGNVFNYDLFTSPNSAEVTLGNNQTGEVNTALTTPIEIEVKNSAGETVAGVPVFFETIDGSFASDYEITDAGGVVTNNWTLGSNTGVHNATAYVKDGNGNIIQTTEITLSATAENAATINPVNTPIPTNNATDITLNGNLSFIEGANTPTDATFKVYFDSNTDPSTIYNLDANTNTLDYSNLQEGTQYYWKVETISNTGTVLATSSIWNFSTLSNTANIEPVTNPTPNDTATNIALNGSLSFTAGANTPTDATYRLYFDEIPNPTTQFDLGNQTSYSYSNLQENTTYYWLIETLSNTGVVLATSSIMSFTTENDMSGGVYDGNVGFSSQQEIDNFVALNYSSITGGLYIGGWTLFDSDISDLSGLSSISSIGGDLHVITYSSGLTSLNGLQNISSIGGDLIIAKNESLVDINNLNNIVEIIGTLDIRDTLITDLNGLSSLTSVYSIKLISNTQLVSLNGLNNLNSTINSIKIENNSALNNISSLININGTINGIIDIADSELQDLSGLDNITSCGGLLLRNNNFLLNLNHLYNLSNINGHLWIIQNDLLNDISGIQNITTISESLTLVDLLSLNSFPTFSNLTNIGLNLSITGNPLINDIDGFTNLNSVNGNILIGNNSSLLNIDGLNSLNSVSNNLYIGFSDFGGTNAPNPNLSDLCGITNLIINGVLSGNYNIGNNAYNPTQQDIINGNCSQ